MRIFTGIVAALLLSGLAHAGGTDDISILYAEPLSATVDTPGTGDDVRLWFDAFGRRFELNLAENQRLRAHRGNTAARIMTGALANDPDSWIRLVLRGNDISGIIRTATDTWLIDPLRDVSGQIADAGAGITTTNVIYRLGDTLVPPSILACGDVATAPETGEDAVSGMLNELQSAPDVLAAQGAAERISLGAVGDVELTDDFGAQAQDAMLTRLNIVDGIFTEELGLEIAVDDVTVFAAEPDPFSSTTDAHDLLDELYDYRVANQLSLGLTHLITGRTLSSSIAGVAYLGSPGTSGACTTSGAGLSEAGNSAFFAALLIAHEIGHNLGAGHDGDPDDACPNEPQTFIMAPTLSGSDQFSTCSMQTMRTVIDAASCIEDVPDVDLAVTSPTEIDVPVDGSMTLAFNVRNNGTFAASSVTGQLSLPPEILAESLSIGGGNCSLGTLSCTLGTLAANGATTVTAGLRATAAGSYPVTLTASTSDDIDPGNDTSSTTLFATNRLDLTTAINGSVTATTNAQLQATVAVNNNSGVTATDVVVAISVSGSATISSLQSTAGICTLSDCTVTTLSPQETLQIDVALTAGASAGAATLSASASANEPDVIAGNNAADLTITVTTPPAAPASGGGGGGGGGALGWPALVLLGGYWLSRLRRLRPRHMVIVDHEHV